MLVGDVTGGALSARAAEALVAVQADPRLALQLAQSVRADRSADPSARSMAARAEGLAHMALDDAGLALAHLRAAVRVADHAGLVTRAAEARMSLAFVLTNTGRFGDALAALDRAAAVLTGGDAGRVRAQRALVLQRLGRGADALTEFRRALEILRREGDALWEARLLLNRGVLHAYAGSLALAEEDLQTACRLATALGQDLLGAYAQHNLGFVAARRGDVPVALSRYDDAQQTLRRLGKPDALADLDRCDLLLSVRLVAEARELATRAVDALEALGMRSDLAEARLMLAQAALLEGDASLAEALAREAQHDFARQRRRGWVALARYVALRAAFEARAPSPQLVTVATRTATALAAAGWTVPALDARVIAARVALDVGQTQVAKRQLALAAAARSRGPASLRAKAWHAEALLRAATGNNSGAFRAIDAGVRVVEDHQATLGATELRAHATGHASELAGLGVRLAVEQRSAVRLLAWAERARASALRFRPARPPEDEALAADLAELRRIVAELDEAALAGTTSATLLRRQVHLEQSVRRRARHARGAERTVGAVPSLSSLSAALGDRALVELIDVDGMLHAVVLVAGRARLHNLGATSRAHGELQSLRFMLRRLAAGRASATSLAAASAAAAASAEALDEQLLRPLRADIADRNLVVVPTGPLHALPWSMLPTCRGLAASVAPSATTWHHCQTTVASAGDRHMALVAAAQPPAAADEVRAVAAASHDPLVLVGDAATTSAVLAAFEDAAVVHIASHARFRADNPLFSCVYLDDGVITVYDLERLRRVPDLVVLSACESGLSAVHAGDELMGLAAALFASGTRQLVASVVPVPDVATRKLMLAFHEQLRRGHSGRRLRSPIMGVADALAAAQLQTAGEDYATRAAAAGFVCFGAG